LHSAAPSKGPTRSQWLRDGVPTTQVAISDDGGTIRSEYADLLCILFAACLKLQDRL
jgi:hypothetical protein